MLSKVFPHQLDSEDLHYFYEAMKTDPHSVSEEDVVKKIYDGMLELWLFKKQGSYTVVMMTDVIEYPDGYREMFICMCSGDQMFRYQEDVDFMKPYARERGCSAITAQVSLDRAVGKFNMIDSVKSSEDRQEKGLNKFDVTYIVISMRV
jgi:hypothetical protein